MALYPSFHVGTLPNSDWIYSPPLWPSSIGTQQPTARGTWLSATSAGQRLAKGPRLCFSLSVSTLASESNQTVWLGASCLLEKPLPSKRHCPQCSCLGLGRGTLALAEGRGATSQGCSRLGRGACFRLHGSKERESQRGPASKVECTLLEAGNPEVDASHVDILFQSAVGFAAIFIPDIVGQPYIIDRVPCLLGIAFRETQSCKSSQIPRLLRGVLQATNRPAAAVCCMARPRKTRMSSGGA